MQKYMLFGSPVRYYARGGMNDFLGLFDSVSDALNFINIEYWERHNHDLQWWHVYDTGVNSVKWGSRAQPHGNEDLSAQNTYYFNNGSEKWISRNEPPAPPGNLDREKIRRARLDKGFPDIKSLLQSKMRNHCLAWNEANILIYISSDNCAKCEQMPPHGWEDKIDVNSPRNTPIPQPGVCPYLFDFAGDIWPNPLRLPALPNSRKRAYMARQPGCPRRQ